MSPMRKAFHAERVNDRDREQNGREYLDGSGVHVQRNSIEVRGFLTVASI